MGEWLARLDPRRDLLVLTADHGCDPTTPGTDHTREHVPLLAAFAGHDGRRHDGPFCDVGASVLRWLAGREADGLPGTPLPRQRRSPSGLRRPAGRCHHQPADGAAAAPRRHCDPRHCGLRRGWSACREAIAGAGAGRAGGRAGPPDDAGAIEALLRERALALERGDAAALAGAATGAQLARDRRALRRTARLSLQSVRVVSDKLEITGDRARIAMTMSYRLRGMRRPFLTTRRLTARRTPAGWRVGSDRARREPLPWEVAAFRATRAPDVVLLTPPGVDPAPLRSSLGDAYRALGRDLPGRELPRGVLVIGSARRSPGRAARGQDRARRRRARQRVGAVRPGAGAGRRARARGADDRDRLALDRPA